MSRRGKGTRAFDFTEQNYAAHQAGTKLVVPEREIQKAGFELLQMHPKVAWVRRANVGAGFLLYADDYKRLVAQGHLKPDAARFVRYGIPGQGDHTGMLRGGRRLEVEYKRSVGGRYSDDQIAFGEAVNGGGGLYLRARSLEELMEGLK